LKNRKILQKILHVKINTPYRWSKNAPFVGEFFSVLTWSILRNTPFHGVFFGEK
jgi:hypothetical protein